MGTTTGNENERRRLEEQMAAANERARVEAQLDGERLSHVTLGRRAALEALIAAQRKNQR